jgi:hypothetical protein
LICASALLSALIWSRTSSNDFFSALASPFLLFSASAVASAFNRVCASALSASSMTLLFNPSRMASNEGHSVFS